MRGFLTFFVILVLTGAIAYFQETRGDHGKHPSKARTSSQAATARIWDNPASLPDHFARHGADFGARNSNEYAQMAAQFLQRAKAEGLPAKVDNSGVIRVFDYRTGTFGAYNRDGTTKTFFKPGNRGYFNRQPGQPVDLRRWR